MNFQCVRLRQYRNIGETFISGFSLLKFIKANRPICYYQSGKKKEQTK